MTDPLKRSLRLPCLPSSSAQNPAESTSQKVGFLAKKSDPSQNPAPKSSRLPADARRQEWKLGRFPSQPRVELSKAENFEAARQSLQLALEALDKTPQDQRKQAIAHQAHVALTNQSVPQAAAVLPILHKALQVGLAGSVPTFGVGRALGVHYGSNAVGPGPASGSRLVHRAIAQLGFGAVGGAVGNLIGKTLIAPQLNKIPRQYKPVHPRAVITDQMVARLNLIHSGWGDDLRVEVAQRQSEVLQIGSDTNIHFAEKAFSLVTAARVLLQPQSLKPNLVQSLAISSGVSGLAGAAVGANMANNMRRASISIPCVQDLDKLPQDQQKGLVTKEVAMKSAHALPLFYPHSPTQTKQPSPPPAAYGRWHLSNLRHLLPIEKNSFEKEFNLDWHQCLHGIASDVKYTGLSALSRGECMVKATAGPVLLGTMQPFVESNLPWDFASKLTHVLLPVIAIKLVIRPWFDALMGTIPARDAALRSQRNKSTPISRPSILDGSARSQRASSRNAASLSPRWI